MFVSLVSQWLFFYSQPSKLAKSYWFRLYYLNLQRSLSDISLRFIKLSYLSLQANTSYFWKEISAVLQSKIYPILKFCITIIHIRSLLLSSYFETAKHNTSMIKNYYEASKPTHIVTCMNTVILGMRRWACFSKETSFFVVNKKFRWEF